MKLLKILLVLALLLTDNTKARPHARDKRIKNVYMVVNVKKEGRQ